MFYLAKRRKGRGREISIPCWVHKARREILKLICLGIIIIIIIIPWEEMLLCF